MKDKDINQRLGRLTPNIRFWLEDHLSTKKTGQANIKTSLLSIFEVFTDDISNINFAELETYFKLQRQRGVADSTLNNSIGHCRRFFEYISTVHGVLLNFDPSELKTLEITDVVTNRTARPLKVSEIAKIRHMLQDDDVGRFAFEMAYLYGCTLKELGAISAEIYDKQLKRFKLKGREIIINSVIEQIIIRNDRVLVSKTEGTYSEYYRLIGERAIQYGILDERGLMWKDINATREKNLLRCAECTKLFENSSENWVLVKFSYDPLDKRWIVCKSCGEKALRHG